MSDAGEGRMLKKFISIKNVGRFLSSGAGGDTELRKLTALLGANGYGKTTLCAVLRSIKTGDAAHIVGRKSLGVTGEIAIDLLFDGAPVRFRDGSWSVTRPEIAIFDGVFVAENVHAGEVVDLNQKRNLYRVIIGGEGVSLADEDGRLSGLSRMLTSDITASERAIRPFCGAMPVADFVQLTAVGDIDQRIVDQQRTVAAVRQAAELKARPALSEFVAPAFPATFASLLGRTIDDVADDAERMLTAHLAAKGMAEKGVDWIGEGLEHAEGTCPFCGQGIEGLTLIAAYRAIFSERYKALDADTEAMTEQVRAAFGDAALARLETVAAQNKASAEFWATYCACEAAPLALPVDLTSSIPTLRQATLDLLARKAAAPDAVDRPRCNIYGCASRLQQCCRGGDRCEWSDTGGQRTDRGQEGGNGGRQPEISRERAGDARACEGAA
jgi:wobble nucleotide-excising tRNase